MINKRWIKKVIALIMAAGLFTEALPFSAFAAGTFTRTGNVLMSSDGGVYYLNEVGGVKAFIPLKYTNEVHDADKIKRAMTSDLGIIHSEGTLATTAAFRYQGFGSTYANLVKYAAQDGITASGAWLRPSFDIGDPTYNVMFRYAGFGITSRADSMGLVSAEVITNPNFPSDGIQAGGGSDQYTVATFKKNADGSNTLSQSGAETVHGRGATVHDFVNIYTNGLNGTSSYPGQGIVNSNTYTGINADSSLAQLAFEKWLNSGSEYAAYYKSKAEEEIRFSGNGMQWWQYLNQYFQINGDPGDDNQTVYFYIVTGKATGHAVYKTYSIPAKVGNNVSPTFIGVVGTDGKVLGESYRNVSSIDQYEGADEVHENSTPVTLVPGQIYSIDAALTYYTNNRSQTNNQNRRIEFYAIPKGNTDNKVVLSDLSAVSSFSSSGYAHASRLDGSTGAIKANAGTTEGYRYGSAGFGTTAFTFEAGSIPSAGYLVVGVTTGYDEYGDNDVQVDDVLMIQYKTEEVIQEITNFKEAYGDMNLGQREYRMYSYFDKEERPVVDEAGNPVPEVDATGKPTGKMTTQQVDVLRTSSYGPYNTADEGRAMAEAGTTIEVAPEDVVIPAEDMSTIWHEGEGWWTYAEQWPGNDRNWKCWVYSDDVNRADEGYTRGIPFNMGWTVARSRGILGTTVTSPTVNVKIYGMAPDIGEELIKEFKVVGNENLPVYAYTYALKQNLVISKSDNGIEDFPRFRVEADISDHNESGIFSGGNGRKSPFNNGWQKDHDSIDDYVFEAESDNMRIKEIEIVDSEGVTIYHADRQGDELVPDVDGFYDREEDLSLTVTVEQTVSANHRVHNPAIDVSVVGTNADGGEYTSYISHATYEAGEDFYMSGVGGTYTYSGIYFRPRESENLIVNIDINPKHNEGNWNENIYDTDEDSFCHVLPCTKADLSMRQGIEVHDSKNSSVEYLPFAEKLAFKFDVEHRGATNEMTAVVGGSGINPYVTVDAKIFDADSLTQIPTTGKLMYGNAAKDDPKATGALLMEDKNTTAATRLFPGLGVNGFASHVQVWMRDYIVQSHVVESGNVAAYGHILVTGEIDRKHDEKGFNRRDEISDYVQQEFVGEKNFKLQALAANARNAVAKDAKITVDTAVTNMASSYNDQTRVDKTYLDIYIDGELYSSSEIEVPVGETVVTETLVDKAVFLDETLEKGYKDKVEIEARVNWGEHQTHYEYVLKSTDSSLYPDPFIDNKMTTTIKLHLPDVSVFPDMAIDDNFLVASVFADDTVNDYEESSVDKGKYTINYEANDGTGTNTAGVVEFQSSITLRPNTYTRSGYVFTGWNTRPDGSGTAYENKQALRIGSPEDYGSNPSLTIYAQWAPVRYTVKFNGNGGVGSMDPFDINYGETKYLPDNRFERNGYVFLGWTSDSAGTGETIENGSAIRDLTEINGSTVTLFAKWLATADCIILEDYDPSTAGALRPGKVFHENPSVRSYAPYETYAFIKITIPTVIAKKAGDAEYKIYDLFTPNWNYDHWELVSSKPSTDAGTPSEYIYAYRFRLAEGGSSTVNLYDASRTADRTTDVFTQLVVGDFIGGTYHGSMDMIAAIVEADETLPDANSAFPAAKELFDSIE